MSGDDAEMTEFAHSELSGSHTAHCFDYFRQSFECSADMSLEWAKPGSKQVDGVGIPHVCTSKVCLSQTPPETLRGPRIERRQSSGLSKNTWTSISLMALVTTISRLEA